MEGATQVEQKRALREKQEEELRVTLVDAFYRRLIDAPDAARRRAQAAYVIASALAAATLGAGALGNLEEAHLGLKILGPTVVVAWLVSAALFLWAVAVPYADPETPKQATGFDEFRKAVLKSHFDEQDEIDRRQFWARVASALAATLTMATVVLALVLDNPPRDAQATLRLHADARRDLTRICAKPIPPVIRGEVDEASLADGTVDVKLENGTCSDGAETAVIDEDEVTYVMRK